MQCNQSEESKGGRSAINQKNQMGEKCKVQCNQSKESKGGKKPNCENLTYQATNCEHSTHQITKA